MPPMTEEDARPLCLAELNATAATFDAVHEAELALLHLQAHGIRARLVDDIVAGIATHLIPALGGIKLKVRPEDEAEARRLIENLRRREPEEATPRPDQSIGWFAAFALLVSAPLPAVRSYRRSRQVALGLLAGGVLGAALWCEAFGCGRQPPGSPGGSPSSTVR